MLFRDLDASSDLPQKQMFGNDNFSLVASLNEAQKTIESCQEKGQTLEKDCLECKDLETDNIVDVTNRESCQEKVQSLQKDSLEFQDLNPNNLDDIAEVGTAADKRFEITMENNNCKLLCFFFK